ncbi:hypothetical protein I5677_09180 [Mobilitalea sibirica]|uniref:Uncharacterized protein n=1 Tax=Mobilitalea sibirica TaxID=1462919 RepID=A0A8J7L2P0_9FIRM|nr:hypothetical protein [Mobilitalea sibirica]MBH1941063.1 hypothetical protein [Mobilitalea sibirica]
MNLEKQMRNEFIEHNAFWNYYGLNVESPFESRESAKRFINDYFKTGSKEYAVFEWREYEGEELSFRNGHTTNVFFIGTMLQRLIDPCLFIKSEVDGEYPFSYLWFLTCLAHDFGYIYENEMDQRKIAEIKDKYLRLCIRERENRKYSRLFLYNNSNMQINRLVPNIPLRSDRCYFRNYSIVSRQQITEFECNFSCRKGLEYSNGTTIKRSWYNYSIKENYFRYRLIKMNTLDHGIVGADKLFSSLVDNYKKEYYKNRQNGRYDNFFNNQGRHFCCEQFKVFAYITNCIAAHNVFMSGNTEREKQSYAEYSLQCLWPENYRIIDYEEDPLLFILCIADTIEPTKRFRGMNSITVLREISISYDTEDNIIHVGIGNKLAQTEEGKKYISDITSLNQWCKIKTMIDIL